MRRLFWLSPLIALMLALPLAACYMPAAPDVTPTPSQQELAEWGMATQMAQMAQETVSPPEPTATPQAPETSPVSVAETPPALPPTETPPPPVPTPVPVPAEASPTPPVQPPAAPGTAPTGETTYVVQPGDRLFRIALRFGVDYRALAAYNNILNPDRIYPGQVLRIPRPGVSPTPSAPGEILYTVQPGDNLFRIALRHNLNYLYLAAYNNISNPHQIRVGQVIRIPVNP